MTEATHGEQSTSTDIGRFCATCNRTASTTMSIEPVSTRPSHGRKFFNIFNVPLRMLSSVLLLRSVGSSFVALQYPFAVCGGNTPASPNAHLGDIGISQRGVAQDTSEVGPSHETGDVASASELERYRNRAALTETVLKARVQDLKIQTAKLEVLQDVVRKLKGKAKDADQSKARYESVVSRLDETQRSLQRLQQDFDQSTQSWEKERRSSQNEIEKLKESEKAEQQLRRKHKETEARLQRIVDNANEKVASMRSSMDQMGQKIVKLKEDLLEEQSERKAAQQHEQQRVSDLKDKLRELKRDRDCAIEDAIMERRDREQKIEAIEIAKSSAAAAERREAAIREKYEDLLSKYESETQAPEPKDPVDRQDIDELHREIEALNDQIRSLKMAHGAQIRAERRVAETRVAEVTEKYQRQMQRVRQEFLAGTGSNQGHSEPRRRGLWRRIRSKLAR